ncbi:MAG: hypothetical protein ACO3FS_06995, partial [Flavobacteriaceae bacterium]
MDETPSGVFDITLNIMKFFLINDGRVIEAKSKVEALRSAGYDLIYWQGITPYAQKWGIYPKRVIAKQYK